MMRGGAARQVARPGPPAPLVLGTQREWRVGAESRGGRSCSSQRSQYHALAHAAETSDVGHRKGHRRAHHIAMHVRHVRHGFGPAAASPALIAPQMERAMRLYTPFRDSRGQSPTAFVSRAECSYYRPQARLATARHKRRVITTRLHTAIARERRAKDLLLLWLALVGFGFLLLSRQRHELL